MNQQKDAAVAAIHRALELLEALPDDEPVDLWEPPPGENDND